MNQKNTSIENLEPVNGWTREQHQNNIEFTRLVLTHDQGSCKICGGFQHDDETADWYCPHDEPYHVESIYVEDDVATVFELGYTADRFDATAENILNWMRDHPDMSDHSDNAGVNPL